MRFRPLLALVLALCLTLVTACGGGAKAVDRANLTYADIHNTGLANDCPTLPDSARGTIPLDASAKYQLRTFLDMLERDDQDLPLGPDQDAGGGQPLIAAEEADSK